MADTRVAGYVKDSDGNLIPIAAIYDKDGNEISSYYAKNTGISLDSDNEGYIVVDQQE